MRAARSSEPRRPRVLIVCAGNSARSPMGEALMRRMVGERFQIWSAGTHPSPLHPLAVAAMREIGLDLRDHRSKSIDEFRESGIDELITVCDRVTEAWPRYFAPAKRTHWPLPDPADVEGPEEVRIEAFRSARDAIKYKVAQWLERDSVVPRSMSYMD